ncbi:hypothetical protein EBZ39_13405 [bacterium]|nr:hypothetical protein [bacterium]
MRVLLPDHPPTPNPAPVDSAPKAADPSAAPAPKKKRFPQRSAKNAEAAAAKKEAHAAAQKPMAEAAAAIAKEKADAEAAKLHEARAAMQATIEAANAEKAAAAAAAAAAPVPIVQEPPKRLKKVAILEPPKPLAVSAPTTPVIAPPAAPAPKAVRKPNAYALAVGKYRKEGMSFAEAAAKAKADCAAAKVAPA